MSFYLPVGAPEVPAFHETQSLLQESAEFCAFSAVLFCITEKLERTESSPLFLASNVGLGNGVAAL
jgi:hypothetical protein